MDQLKVDKMTRESQLAQAQERVQRGAVREREADAKISQLQAQLVRLQDTHQSLVTHKTSLEAAQVDLGQELDQAKTKVAYMLGLLLYKSEAPAEDKRLHLDLRQQQHLQNQCRDLQASCLAYQLAQRETATQISSLGARLDDKTRLALEQDILYQRALH
eukprot:Tamp_17333.p2 GENE.Tamp_17333~~Tamp_17333.p2  ORF type:complete len:160 (+),score=39.37 Tamp_17333:735-1214(+)